MQQEYLLDTNAVFNLLKAWNKHNESNNSFERQIEDLKAGKATVSLITTVEIISVLGKYARGAVGGFQKCNCVISEDGQRCQNSRYSPPRKRWNKRIVKAWMQLISETLNGNSKLVNFEILPFDSDTIAEAQKIVRYALTNNFASMDAMIAATARIAKNRGRNITVVTSDKGLKVCLDKCKIPYVDWFRT